MKTQVLNTRQGKIIKIACDASDRMFKSYQRKFAPLHFLSSDGAVAVYCDRYHQTADSRFHAKIAKLRVNPAASKLQRQAARWALNHGNPASRRGGWSLLCENSASHKLAARYALNPMSYTAPAVAPKLP